MSIFPLFLKEIRTLLWTLYESVGLGSDQHTHPIPWPRPNIRTDDLAVIPAAMVHPLAQQLNGWLGAIGLQGWHVQVINEEDEVAPQGRPEHAFPPAGRGCVSPGRTAPGAQGVQGCRMVAPPLGGPH